MTSVGVGVGVSVSVSVSSTRSPDVFHVFLSASRINDFTCPFTAVLRVLAQRCVLAINKRVFTDKTD